ncbi:tautomerase family protein [Lysinibacillus sp. YS11]|uniref:4-oxalocrotonate tautomerase n=2 Tax=Lysinibacillus TaxID=400634 RepID=A0A2X1BTW2_9BACI|nr:MULTISPECIES: tautomerase family protein [Lysinibacillus]AUS87587.1 tautomerase family protein [Lysinibacillus sp. YS11]KGR87697.1 4-oxalocrotonate tautomerase [Lysinibacillus boronitolerans JCM 21713 = 10a = NBRC 103108]KMN39806.1 4-oxalocrotonate tautomerase [Lysinibacillus sp. LK3]MCR6521455.1 tautomerase family protein [Lysinibacillus capsici]MED3797973.1 tautomerase family protein [Lysinibacillus capsici]
MGQIKIYGVKGRLNPIKETLSNIIHSCMVDALEYPLDKKFHRFFPMDKEDFYFASERTESYTIIEISMFEGRTIQAKKQLVKLLFERINNKLNISPQDVEITIFETPKHNWGIRGLPGDELALNYKVNI